MFLSGSKVRFTEPWNYSVAPEKYILGLHNYPEKLIASRNYGYVLTCSNAEVIDLRKDCNQGGCHTITQIEEIQPIVGKLSADIHDDGVVYASTEGLVYLRGASSGNLTMNIFNKQQWLDLQPHTMRGVVHNGYYYGSTDTDTFRLLMPTSANGSEAEQFSYLSIKAKAWFRTRDNRLLYTDDTGTHEFQEGDSFKEYEFVSVHSHTFRPVIAANFMLHADCGKVDASVAMDNKRCGITATDLTVRGNRQYRVKKQLAYGHQVTIKGTAEVFAFTLGTGTNKTETPLEIIESFVTHALEMNADLGSNEFDIDIKWHILGLLSGDIFTVLYKIDGKIVGHQGWHIYTLTDNINKKRATLRAIYIKKEFQKRGLFKEFLNYGIAEVKKLNLDSVTIATTVGNKLYQICEAYEYRTAFVEYEV
jgi:hypothetical protein